MSCSLPFELILLIVSHVAKDGDEDSLKKLSLTSSALRGPCQSYLFSDLTLTSGRLCVSYQCGKLPGERLLGLLSSSPVIASYVKNITLSGMNWLRIDQTLSEALHKLDLSKIKGFTLHLAGSWKELPPSTWGVITEICQSPALLEITLWWAPVELLQFCGPSLKRITAMGQAVENMDVGQWPREFNLQYLRISHCFHISAIAGYILDSTRLRITRLGTLQVTISSSSDLPQVVALTHLFRTSLKFLVLEVHTYIRNVRPGASSIAECPNLTELDLRVDLNIDKTCLISVVRLVCSIPPSNRLRKISLDVQFEDNDKAFSEIPIWTKNVTFRSLRVLGGVVINSAIFPRLEALDLNILIPGSAEDISTINEWALDALSIPPERDMVHLGVSFYR